MAMCSLASARARDGALYSNRRSPSQLSHPPPEVFWTAAAESIPRNLAAARGIEYMRACAILSITAIQNGQIREMHKYLGHYHTLSIMEGLHDEKSWPKDLSTIEVEVRRRLFWSMYTLDVYSATVWGGMVRFREIQSNLRLTGPVTGDPENDIVGFQSANIQATLQLLNMVLSSNEDQGIEEKCEVAGNVLNVFTKVPIEYLKAISSPLLYHLGGIGFILGSVMEGSLSEVSYQRIRKLLLEMAALLYQMESGLTRSTGASERLKTQVMRIDEYMDKTRHASMHVGLAEIGQSQHFEGYVQPSAVQSADFDDPLTCFELPSDLLDDWPWSSGAGSLGGMFPMALAKTDN
ncbi:hypothetical protein APSETT444_009717 [Aspergillus pseudonomiae]